MADDYAIRVFNALSNGMGGISWDGLETLATLYGVEDVEGLIERLIVIKTHEPKGRTE